jgi:hypothetical protein
MPWNEGEEKMHRLLRVPPQDNPTSAMLTPQASFMFQRAPLLALGTLDAQSRPWATLWGGEPGFSEQSALSCWNDGLLSAGVMSVDWDMRDRRGTPVLIARFFNIVNYMSFISRQHTNHSVVNASARS